MKEIIILEIQRCEKFFLLMKSFAGKICLQVSNFMLLNHKHLIEKYKFCDLKTTLIFDVLLNKWSVQIIPIFVANKVECNHQLLKLFILCKKEQPKHLKYSCQTNQLSIENYKRKLQLLLRAASCSQKAIYCNNIWKESFLCYIYIYSIFCLKKSL